MTTWFRKLPWQIRVAIAVLLTFAVMVGVSTFVLATGDEEIYPGKGAPNIVSPFPSSDPYMNPSRITPSTRPAVTKVDMVVKPETEGEIPSIERVGNEAFEVVGAKCAEGYKTMELPLDGSTKIPDLPPTVVVNVMTTEMEDGSVIIDADNKLYSVESLLVNYSSDGVGAMPTPITDDVMQATDNRLRINLSDWRSEQITSINSLAFCLGGSAFNAPVN